MNDGAGTPGTLDPRVVVLWRAAVLGRTAVALATLAVVHLLVPGRLPVGLLMGLAGAAGAAAAVAWPPAYYRSWRFHEGASELILRHGVFWRTTSIIPFARIQHVDTRQGPLERWLGLAQVVVYTAGIRGAESVLPGLPAPEAETLRDRLAAVAGSADAV